MKKALFITEKPSVAMDYVKLLNVKSTRRDGYIEGENSVFTWCVGHLVTMCYPEAYDAKLKTWSLSTLPFIPDTYKYEVIPAVKKQFDIVASLLKRDDIDTIYVCTDSGREGEYIYRLVDDMVGVEGKKKKRVWIDSQTEEEIKRGIKEAKELEEYDALSDSAYLRAKEDYLQGINFSRLLTLIYGDALAQVLNEDFTVVAVGRVMSCVLGMIVDRERDIKNFVKDYFYKIQGSFTLNEEVLNTEWKVTDESRVKDSPKLYSDSGFKKREDAEEFIDSIDGKFAVVKSITKHTEKKNAPLLFNLAEIQNLCSKRLKIPPEETLSIVQELYEKKLVTYPRTDARVLSTAVGKEIGKTIGKLKNYQNKDISDTVNMILENKSYQNINKTKYVDDKKITDHYAIIPTGEGLNNINGLKDKSFKVYEYILRRFLAIFLDPAKFSKVAVEVVLDGESFFVSSKTLVDEGYMKIYTEDKTKEREDKISKELVEKLKKGTLLNLSELTIKEGETSPPKRYSSGSIILAMENAGKLIEDEELREHIINTGIGTSATRGEIIKKLNNIGYISTNNKTQIISPTTKGELIYEVIKDSVPSLLNPILTASWEKGLKQVCDKEIESNVFMEKLEKYIKSNIAKAMRRGRLVDGKSLFKQVIEDKKLKEPTESKVLGICPICNKGLVRRNSKGYNCTNFNNGCSFFVGEICGVKMGDKEIYSLIKNKRTDVISGFKSKSGNEFKAMLIIKDNKISLQFCN